MDVTAITRRRDAILTSIISQVTPSESSVIERIGMEPLFSQFPEEHARHQGHQARVDARAAHQHPQGHRADLQRDVPTTEIWRALYGAAVLHRAAGKSVIAVNDDIDPDNADAILWAMSFRANPSLDFHILPHRDQGHGPRSKRNGGQDTSVLIDATLKENFPPISLPKREYMERAKVIWEELGLPKLKPEAPSVRLFARRMAAGDGRSSPTGGARRLFETGALLEKRRREGRSHEYGGAKRRRAQTKTGQAQTVLNRRRRSLAGDLRAPALPGPTTPGQRGCSQCRTTLSQARSSTRSPSASANGSRSTPSFPGFPNW